MRLSTRSLWVTAAVLVISGVVLLFAAVYEFRAGCLSASSPCPGPTCAGPAQAVCIGAWTPLAVGLVVLSVMTMSGGVASAALGELRRVTSTG